MSKEKPTFSEELPTPEVSQQGLKEVFDQAVESHRRYLTMQPYSGESEEEFLIRTQYWSSLSRTLTTVLDTIMPLEEGSWEQKAIETAQSSILEV